MASHELPALWEISVNLFSVENAINNDFILFSLITQAIFSKPNSIKIPLFTALQLFDMRKGLKNLRIGMKLF